MLIEIDCSYGYDENVFHYTIFNHNSVKLTKYLYNLLTTVFHNSHNSTYKLKFSFSFNKLLEIYAIYVEHTNANTKATKRIYCGFAWITCNINSSSRKTSKSAI